jgi:hypothetical protein
MPPPLASSGGRKGVGRCETRHPGSTVLGGDVRIASFGKARLKEPPLVLDEVLNFCGYLHVRTNHVHAVVGGETKPESFKRYATRA